MTSTLPLSYQPVKEFDESTGNRLELRSIASGGLAWLVSVRCSTKMIQIIHEKWSHFVISLNRIVLDRSRSRGRYRPCESCDFTRSNCLNYIKSGKLSTKSGKSELPHVQY